MDADRRLLLVRRGSIAGGAALLIAAAIVLFRLLPGGPTHEREPPKIVQLRIVTPPPPPPPPPQKLPEPKMVEQPKMHEPMVKPDKIVEQPKAPLPQPPGPLALDTKGEGAPDAFGLVGNPGGNGLLGGGGGGSEGTRFGWYAAMIQGQIQALLQKEDKLRGARYRIAIRLWLDAGGKPTRVELINSTGESELDGLLKQTLLQMSPLKEAPPGDMPQPIILRIGAQRG